MGGGAGPTLVVTAGLHGNEHAGIEACEQLLDHLGGKHVFGEVHLIAGNLKALEKSVRCIDTDLNRVWDIERVERDLEQGPLHEEIGAEADEMHELNQLIHRLMKERSDIVFIDLHTTSSQTVPFITMCDTLLNRSFVKGLGVPVVIGIEEYLFHPLLAYVMEKGHVSVAYESGQHMDPSSAIRHFHFLMLVLDRLGMVQLSKQAKKEHLDQICFNDALSNAVFDVRYRQPKNPGDGLLVLPGFSNFDPVMRGRKLAEVNGEFIRSSRHCRIFMPLYQSQGNDAFFLIGRMPGWWRAMSRTVRTLGLQWLAGYLVPGSAFIAKNKLRVGHWVKNSRMKHVLHFLGFRLYRSEEEYLTYINR